VLHSILLIAFFYVYKYVRKSKQEIIGNSNKIGKEDSKNFYDWIKNNKENIWIVYQYIMNEIILFTF